MAAMPSAELARRPACDAAHLILHLDALSRTGAGAWAISARPGLRFDDAGRRALPI